MTIPIRLPSRTNAPDQAQRLVAAALDAPIEEQYRTTAGDYAVQDADDVILANSGSPQTITLPSPATFAGRTITVIRTGTGACTVVSAGGATISGAASRSLGTQWDSFTFMAVILSGTATWVIR